MLSSGMALIRSVGSENLPLTALGSSRDNPSSLIFANEPPFKATGKGVADDTEALRSAFDFAIETGRTLVLQGTYRVTASLVEGRTRTQGTLNLHFADSVVIEVDKSAAHFDTLIHLMTDQAIQSLFSGTRLTVLLNGRCACGLVVRYLSQSAMGQLVWLAPVNVYDAFNDVSNETTDNYGVAVLGRFREVRINNPTVVGVRRARTVGESKSLSVVGYTGTVTISQPYLANVTAPEGEPDVDLLALFPAPEPDSPWSRRSGMAFVNHGSFIDSQGRSIKLQGRAVLTENTYVRTGKVVAMRESCEVDAQFDQVVERGATYRYNRSSDGRTPLGEHHVLLSVQHLVGGVELNSVMAQAQVFSEVPIWGCVSINQAVQTQANSFNIADVTIRRLGSFSGDVFQRAIIEFDADKVTKSAGTLSLSVKNVSGPMGVPIIGYNVSSTSFFSKAKATISDSRNSGTNVAIVDSIGGRLELPVFAAQTANNSGWSTKKDSR